MTRLRRNAHQEVPEEPEKKKRKSHGPRKGGSFERDICRAISLWWTDQERDDIFWRTSGSGARATVRTRKGQTTANSLGDLAVLDPIGEPFLQFFMVEIKRGYPKAWDWIGLLDRPKSYQTTKQKKDTFYGWWEKLLEESKENKKRPLLIFKRDRSDECVAIDAYLFFEFQAHFGFYPVEQVIHYHFGIYDFTILTLEGFFNWISPEGIKGVLDSGQNQIPTI